MTQLTQQASTKRRAKTPADYHALAKQRGFKWLGKQNPNVNTNTTWRCSKGHRWLASYTTILECGCPFCSGTAPKTPADYHALAKRRGFKWLGPEVSRIRFPTTWECSRGHRWQTIYQAIALGTHCPVCSGRAPKTPADYHALAKKSGLKWLGPQVANTTIKTDWQCRKGHIWHADYASLQTGYRCPRCFGRVHKTPDDYRVVAKRRGFKWLGPQVPTTSHPTGWQCALGHRWKAAYNNIRIGTGCHECNHEARRIPPAGYRALARQRGFKWLGPSVTAVKIKSTWQCSLGHQWQAAYSDIKKGSGCPTCAGPSDIRHKSVTRRLPARALRTRG